MENKKRGAGFTLIELLVVVGIIGLLAGLIMPALGKAREQARSSFCINNLKQLYMAVEMYRDSNDQIFPYAQNMPKDPLTIRAYPAINVALQPYLKSAYIFKCPDDTGQIWPDQCGSSTAGWSYFSNEGSSYEYSQYLSGKKRDLGRGITFLGPSRIWVLYDYQDFHGPGRSNFVFLDGHASNQPVANVQIQITD